MIALLVIAQIGVVSGQFLSSERFRVLPRDAELSLSDESGSFVKSYLQMYKADIDHAIELRRTGYKEDIVSIRRVVYITALLIMAACMLLATHKHSVSIPLLPEIQIPTVYLSLGVAAAIGYYWVYFGFLLNQLIDTRMALVSLVEQVFRIQTGMESSPSRDAIADRKMYLLTIINDLKDTGFIDAWFMQFLPKYYPMGRVASMDHAVPNVVLITVGALLGISHACWTGLALKWPVKHPHTPIWAKWLVRLFLVFSLWLLIMSHHMFLYTGNNGNWLQLVIVGFFVVGFTCVCLCKTPVAETLNTKRAQREF